MAIHFDATAPSAAPGDMWWSGGKLALAIDDTTSLQWVQISSASDVPMPGPWDFPDAPTTGQGFTPVPGGATMTWDGQMWTFPAGAAGGSMITIADTAPTGTVSNTLWWDSDSGDLFVNYNDLDSTQWVQINTAAPASTGGATGDFLPLDGSGTMTGSLKLASGMGVSYLNAGGAGNQWVEMVSATTFDFLGSTAPFVYSIEAATNNISFAGDVLCSKYVKFQTDFNVGIVGPNRSLYFTSVGANTRGDMFLLDPLNDRADFLCPLFVNNTPVVMLDQLQARDDRIAALEERLARLEAR